MMNKIKILGVFCMLISCDFTLADTHAVVRPSSVVLNYKDQKISVQVTNSREYDIELIKIVINGKETVLKGADVFNFSYVDLSKIEVLSMASLNGQLNDDGELLVSLPSFDIRDHGTPQKAIEVVGRLELTFADGKLKTVDLDIPLGDLKNKWLIKGYGIKDGEKIFFKEETVDSVSEP